MMIKLALDAMGGDAGVPMVVAGANRAIKQRSDVDLHFTFYGDLPTIQNELKKYNNLADKSTVVHADIIITNDMKPASAVRSGRRSNLGMAISSVYFGENQAVVSAGNTGAYMALSKIILKTLPGVDRPAIPSVLPTVNGHVVVLDLGANVECSSHQLVQFALMGVAFAHQRLGIKKPSVGLLNIGSEDLKGNATIQAAAQLLRNVEELNFYGFVEGDDIAAGTTDVVVTDGFTGNIALKTIEGTAKLIRQFMVDAFSSSFMGKLAYLVARPVLKKIQKRSDPRMYNGAVFLGLQHIAVKSHGGTDDIGFANAINVGIDMVQQNLIQSVQDRLETTTLPQSVTL